MSQQTTAILGLLAETSIHAGAGSTVGVIDLPIQREAHTGYPCIFGSSVKGPMRTLAEQKMDKSVVEEIFGPDVEDSKTEDGFHAGALAVSDARLLLLPVRSLTSHFKWVTCPAILRRWQADCRRLQIAGEEKFPIPELSENNALIASVPNNKSAANNKVDLFLEEFRFKAEVDEGKLKKVIDQIAFLMGREDAVMVLHKQLTVVNDDMFSHLARYATPVNAHIALDYAKKTVKTGALWYEETLPPETLMYTCLLASRSRKQKGELDAAGVLAKTLELFPEKAPYLQLGGNETVGMGWCKVKFLWNF